MKIHRRFTRPGEDVFDSVEWARRSSRITNADGSLVFEMNDAEVPADWSQLAVDIMVSKYFRKAGVPQFRADGTPVTDASGDVVTGPERSVRQVVHRLAGCWREWGEKHDYFDAPDDAQAFYDELAWMLLHQVAAPNSPQWFNTGLSFAYGISGPAQGHWVADPETGATSLASDAYSHPQPHACFIQSVSDDLVNEGGIMDLWTREARLFKYGSGTGTNFSQLRAENEPLSGGGKSSGLMSFLKIGDRAAAAIKSGGTTRRAAKMVCLDADHPDIESFVNWKVREELKVAALVEGLKHLPGEQRELAESLGLKLDYDFNGEAYYTVSGQNSNNSVRLTHAFLEAVEQDGDWDLVRRTDGEVMKTVRARDLWEQITFAAWRCADPGLQYDTAINEWHTCPASGRINASNPCSEYMFLDDTACNLASINLLTLYDRETRRFDVERFEHAIELWTMVLEISVLMASFPSRDIADRSWRYRTLGLGYANLGAMLMQAGIPYDSEAGRAVCGSITSILTGRSYAASALMASEHGPFPGYAENRDHMLRVMRNHRRAARGEASGYEALTVPPVAIDHDLFGRSAEEGGVPLDGATGLLDRAVRAWDDAIAWGERHGYRNAQTTVIAPTGTIGLLMDCDTTGVEPDYALVKFKKLAGGGYFKIANASLDPALEALGYDAEQRGEMMRHVMGTQRLDARIPGDPNHGSGDVTFVERLLDLGFSPDDLKAIEAQLPSCFELKHAFTAWSLPEAVMRKLGIDPEAARADMSFDGLAALGFDRETAKALNRTICGSQTIEGAPHLKDEHLPVFDCANRCGPDGRRFIAPEGHIRMMAAAQPFISGAISKTINLPADASVEDVSAAYLLSWKLGLKANALYRDGSKLSQPLNSTADEDDGADEDEDAVDAAREEVVGEVLEVASAATGAAPEATIVEKVVERIIERPMRRRLPDTRSSVTHRFNVAGHEGYLTVGLYDDGRPGELFITMSKEGSTIGGLMDSLGTAISVALQYGVPIESLTRKFAHQRFEPMGMTTNADIPFAKSLVDYIFRWLGMEFVPGYREQNAPARPGAGAGPGAGVTGSSTPRHPRSIPARTATASIDDDDADEEDDRWSAPESERSTNGSTPTGVSAPGNGSRGANGPRPTNGSSRTSDLAGPARTDADPTNRASAGDSSAASPARPDASSGSSSTSARATHAEILLNRHGIGGTDEQVHVTADSYSVITTSTADPQAAAMNQMNASMQSDAPACDVCGAITVRNGACYKCVACGNSLGCS